MAAVFLATFAFSDQVNAQYKPIGDDGIAASPRLRQQLNERKTRATAVSAAVPAMACPKCQDSWVAQPDTEPKGLGARTLMSRGTPTKLVAKHLCEGCGVDWTIAGTGKAKHPVATHKCSDCGSENLACCSTKDVGGAATKGMELD